MSTNESLAGRRRAFLRTGLALAPAVVMAAMARAQSSATVVPQITDGDETAPVRLPSGQLQQDAILKADYDLNVKDAREMTALAKSIELDFDKYDQNVLSLGLLKKLDDMDKITKRIRGRIKR